MAILTQESEAMAGAAPSPMTVVYVCTPGHSLWLFRCLPIQHVDTYYADAFPLLHFSAPTLAL